jgi:hypothetical protein
MMEALEGSSAPARASSATSSSNAATLEVDHAGSGST